MAKFKTEMITDREANEMRHVEVEIDFTPNALASILYRQGDTVILACCTKEARLLAGFLETQQRVGCMLNTPCSLVQPILVSEENEEVQKDGLKKLNALLLVHFVPQLTLKH